MRLVHRNGLSFYQFEHLAALSGIRHGFFPRWGGVSRAPFETLNVTHGLGDPPGNVAENRRRITLSMGGDGTVYARQVHATTILVHGDAGKGPIPTDAGTGDAIISDRPGCNLAIQVADCQAIILVDAARGVVANVHSGWRGSIGNIIGRVVDTMASRFGSRPRNIHAGVGPSLGPCCAEFVNYREEIPEKLWSYRDSRNRFDFWAISCDQLRRSGVPPEQIEVGGLCTRCRSDLFFSYRGEGTTGRMAAVVGIGETPGR